MNEKILISTDNLELVLSQVLLDIKTKISNKDISLPYTQQLSKSSYITINGLGTMYLSNNGSYIELGNINKSNIDIQKIYDIFNIESNSTDIWSTKIYANTLAKSGYSNGLVYNDKIYYFNGYTTSGAPVDHIDVYDIALNTWSILTKFPVVHRYGCGIVFYKEKIYCIAGHTFGGTYYTNRLDIYDIASNIWTTGANFPISTYLFGCVLYNDKIYCLTPSFIYIYDILSNTWSSIACSLNKLAFGCVLYNDKIYCIGGEGPVNSVNIYDINTNTWTIGSKVPTAASSFGCVLYKNDIYCIGGTGATQLVQVYNIDTNTWDVSKPHMPIARYALCSVLYKNDVYCIGGIYLNTINVLNLPYTSYVAPVSTSVISKASKIINTGDGIKVLGNDCNYKTITPSYINMTNIEIVDMTTRLNNI